MALLGNRRYAVRQVLGEGGMGLVYEATDRERGTRVALKTLRETKPEGIARFKREFRALTDVIHTNLVTLYELVAEGDQLFFTMELVEGRRFNEWVRVRPEPLDGPTTEPHPSESLQFDGRTDAEDPVLMTTPTVVARSLVSRPKKRVRPADPGVLDVDRLRLALRQLAEGVAAIHEAGLLHRDLKPSNVLVTDAGRVVILDFGLVTDLQEESLSTVDDRPLEGTVQFMSPEQAARLPLTRATDWYSVGVMLYICLTGRAPFDGGRDDILMDKQVQDPPRPSTFLDSVPADLDELCMALLRRDPAARPRGAEILARLGVAPSERSSHGTSASSHRSQRELIGRDPQLGALTEALTESRERGPVLVHLRGSSGMGKSHLLREYLARLGHEGGALVLSGRCYERESVPFKAVDSVIDALARHLGSLSAIEAEGLMPRDAQALARVFPVLHQIEAFSSLRRRTSEAPSPAELRRRSFGALRELLSRLADRKPLVIAVDDVHWADVDSAGLLATLLRPPEAPAMLLIAAYRSEEALRSDFLVELAAQTSGWPIVTRTIEVAPLHDADAKAVARHHLGSIGLSDAELALLVREAQGSPLFLEELARRLRDQPSERDATGLSLSEVLKKRLERLPEPASRLLATVAVAGRPLVQELALRASDVRDPAFVSVLRAGSLLRGAAIGGVRYFEPYHDRVRETVVSSLSEAQLLDAHRRLARAYESTPTPDPETLVFHLRGAGELARAAEYAAQGAARAAQSLAFDRAARLYRLALELEPGQPRAIRLALAEALVNAGRGAEAAEVYLSATDGAPAAETLELSALAASHLLASGHLDRGLEIIGRVMAQMDMSWPRSRPAQLLSFLVGRARLRLHGLRFTEREEREVPPSQLTRVDVAAAAVKGLGMADTLRGAELAPRYTLLALTTGEPKRVMRALIVEAVFVSLRGPSAAKRVAAILAKVEELAKRLADPALEAMRLGGVGMVAFNEGRFREAHELCARAEQQFRDHGHGYRWELATSQVYAVAALVLNGRLPELFAIYPRWLAEAEERGDLYSAVTTVAMAGVYQGLAHDEPERARADVEGALARWTGTGLHLQHTNSMGSLVNADLYSGDGISALARVDAIWPAIEQSMFLRVQTMRSFLLGARGKALLGAAIERRLRSDRALTAVARALEADDAAHAKCQGRYLRAALQGLAGNLDTALVLGAEAEQLAQAADLQLMVHSFRRWRGRLIGGDQGQALVASADEFFAAQGVRVPARFAEVYAPWFGRG